MTKTFVLDTNVLLHNHGAIDVFADNKVVLPMAVIEELDQFKTRNDELGRNARAIIRNLDALRALGSLGEGVTMENGGTLQILTSLNLPKNIDLDPQVMDNRILRVAWHLHREGGQVIFVSKDINARLKADALGMTAQDFEKEKVDFDDLYTGYREIQVSAKQVDEFFEKEEVTLSEHEFYPHEFILMRDETNLKHTALGRAKGRDSVGHLNPKWEHAWNIKGRSKEQRMAFEILLDPAVELVTLVGQAGTGKTLLALAAGLEMTIKHKRYEKLLVSRPVIPMGNDIGYLPGSKDEKLFHWMQPIFDNLAFLMGDKKEQNGNTASASHRLDDWIEEEIIELEALTYIRGRSISNQYVIVDEAQNLTPHEVKTIVSRSGEGTKMVLTGDPNQIDNPYLDTSSNGLSYTVEQLKSQKVHGHITLNKSERSTLAAVAAEYL